MIFADLGYRFEYLQRKLPGRSDDQRAQSVQPGPSIRVQLLKHGNEEGQRFSAARFGRRKDVFPLERRQDRLPLNGRRNAVLSLGQPLYGLLR